MPPLDPFRDVGATVRTVVTLGRTDWEIEYIRDDVAEAYTDDDLDAAYRALIANRASSDDFDQRIEFGDLEAQVYIFEELVAFQFPTGRYESLYVSYDRQEPFPVFEVLEAATARRQSA